MKNLKTLFIVSFVALLFVAGRAPVRAQAVQQTGDQSQSDSSAAAKDKKKQPADAPAAATPAATAVTPASPVSKPTAPAPAAPAIAPSSKPTTAQQTPPANNSGMVWVNAVSGVYHKPGTHWYGKTKKGKYMTEADAQKAGYRPAKERGVSTQKNAGSDFLPRRASCFPKSYFSRRITSPWPTSWSFSQRRYL